MRWPWRLRWYRWTAVVVGDESGHVTDLSFVRFRHEREAMAWVRKMNSGDSLGLTHYEVRPILPPE